jgi:hypothetical protein
MKNAGTFYLVAAIALVAGWFFYKKSVATAQAAANASAGGLVGSLNTVYTTTDAQGAKLGVVGRVGSTILTHPVEDYTSGNWDAAEKSAATAGWSDIGAAIGISW